MKKESYQRGTVVLVPRKTRPDVWALRYYEYDINGKRTQKNKHFADVTECPTITSAERKADALRLKISDQMVCVYFENLAVRYEKDDMPVRGSTRGPCQSNVKRLIQAWGRRRLDWMCSHPIDIQNWLKTLKTHDGRELAHKSKRNLKSLLHRMFECAMAWGYVDMQRNPIDFVQVRGIPRQVRPRRTITIQQYDKLINDPLLSLHVKVMIQIAAMTGLRVSEILGLKWEDVDLRGHLFQIRRSVVGRHEDQPKSEASEAEVPITPELASVLKGWRKAERPVNGWLFGSELTGRPFHRDSLQERHLGPAGRRAGISGLGWHSFRHTYRAMLRELGTPLEVQQYLMRHASITTTMQYGKFDPERARALREVNTKLVALLPKQKRHA